MGFLKIFLIVALSGIACPSWAQEISVTFQPQSAFSILTGTKDILAVQIEPASAARDIHFMIGKHENGEYIPTSARDYLNIAELESGERSGIKYIVVEARQNRTQYEADFYIMAVRNPYRGKADRLAMVDVFIQAGCPHTGYYRGSDFVTEICGKSHLHENGQTVWLPSDNAKHLYNESHLTIDAGRVRPLQPGDADYQSHNENVCQYCLSNEWIWWRALGALRGAYNSPGSRPVQLFDYYFGDALGVDAKIGAVTLWTNEHIFTPVLKVIGIPFEYLESKLVALGLSRTDIEATYLHLMVGIVRLPRFQPIGTYAKAAMAEKMANVEKALAVVKNRLEWAPGLKPVLVTPEGMAFGSELSLSAFSEMADQGGCVGKFLKGAGGALRAGKDLIVGTNPFAFGAEFWKAVRGAVKPNANGMVEGILFIPKFIKNNPTSSLFWYPAYLAMSLNTELGPVSDWVVRPLLPNRISFILADELYEFAQTYWPVLRENEVVAVFDAEILGGNREANEKKRQLDKLYEKFGKDKVYRFYIEDLDDIDRIAAFLKNQGKRIRMLYWRSHSLPGEIGVRDLENAEDRIVITKHNSDVFNPLSGVLSKDALWVFSSCALAAGETGGAFCQKIQKDYIPDGVLIAPTVVNFYVDNRALTAIKAVVPMLVDFLSPVSYGCVSAHLQSEFEMNPDDPLIKVFQSD